MLFVLLFPSLVARVSKRPCRCTCTQKALRLGTENIISGEDIQFIKLAEKIKRTVDADEDFENLNYIFDVMLPEVCDLVLKEENQDPYEMGLTDQYEKPYYALSTESDDPKECLEPTECCLYPSPTLLHARPANPTL
ncbi:hypothetical protein ROHU_015199 [Labeo rohita]|uniref:Uncharacterized protein n=1 Tax=Labeo rohita TaxID=84645 RepID=A0A498NQ34_LABRO|nr:hypothetical protein ROHU_015199 [Labeo rohita]